MYTRVIFLCLMAVFCSCVDQSPVEKAQIKRMHRSVGVPQNGFPNWQERTMHMMINRARCDPAAEITALCPWETEPKAAVNPLVYDYDLARASRFQVVSLQKAGGSYQEGAVCALAADLGTTFPDTCDGSPSCACQTGVANCGCIFESDWSGCCTCPSSSSASVACPAAVTRVQLFRPVFLELAHSGIAYQPSPTSPEGYFNVVTVYEWFFHEDADREKILNGDFQEIGVGYTEEPNPNECSVLSWTVDYLMPDPAVKTVTIPLIPAASHLPETGPDGTEFDFRANYFHVAGGPTKAEVVIDGECHPMALERGTQTNGTWLFTQALSSPATGLCPRYYFKFTDPSGAEVIYPSAGSLQVSVGAANSCSNHVMAREAEGDSCSEVAADAGSGSDTSDLGADRGAVDASADQQSAPVDSRVMPPKLKDSGGCSYAALPPTASSIVLVLLLALGLTRRKRAR